MVYHYKIKESYFYNNQNHNLGFSLWISRVLRSLSITVTEDQGLFSNVILLRSMRNTLQRRLAKKKKKILTLSYYVVRHKRSAGVAYLISYSSRENGFHDHTSCFSSYNAKSQTRTIIHQFDSFHMLPVNLKTKLPY